MAPRRGARVLKVERSVDYNNLTVKEVLCPICRSILIEPVTLPCNHVFCSSCFQGTMENANLVCPLCRLRIGSWLRSCKKENKLIDINYWNAIKKMFPEQIKNKLEGLEDNITYEDPLIKIAKPGELKKEYETQIKKETETFRKEREAEIKASEALILKLKEEEEYQRLVEEEKLRLDEEIARKLAEEFNYEKKQKNFEVPSSNMKSSSSNINNNLKKCGPLDRFIQNKSTKATESSSILQHEEKKIDYAKKDYSCRVLCHDVKNDCEIVRRKNEEDIVPLTLSMLNQKMSTELQHILDLGDSSDSGDSIESECRYFKPIDYRRSLLCQRTTPIRVPAIKQEIKKNHTRAPEGQNMFQSDHFNTAFAAFKKLSLEENEHDEERTTRYIKVKNKLEAKSNDENLENREVKNKIIPERKTNIKQPDRLIEPSTPQKNNKNNIETKKSSSSVKRKLCKKSPDYYPNKKTKSDVTVRLDFDSPTSPFRGFEKSGSEENTFQKRITRNNRVGRNIDPEKINQQVKSDYELAKRLQEQFDNTSYSTRSCAPKRGTKVTKQATLDRMVVKQSKFKN